jgi:hypothetical protein
MPIDSPKKRFNYENNEKLQRNVSMILILETLQAWHKLKERLLPWLKIANLLMSHHLFKTTETNTSRIGWISGIKPHYVHRQTLTTEVITEMESILLAKTSS